MPIPETNSTYDQQTNWFFTTRLPELKARAEKLEFVDPAELIEKLEWAWKELAELSEKLANEKLANDVLTDEVNDLEEDKEYMQDIIDNLRVHVSDLQASETGLNQRIDELLKEKANLQQTIDEFEDDIRTGVLERTT